MAQSLFNFNTVFIPLSSPPPNIDGIFTINKNIQSITKIYLDYNKLLFNIKPFKVIIEWPGRAPVVINDVYIHDSIKDPLSTYSPTNSALSFSVVAPKQTNPSTQTATVKIYYENGVKHTFNINLAMSSDNIIDLDLDVLDIQNTSQPFSTVFNIQSNLRNVVFNSTDLIIPEKYIGNSPNDGYYE